MKKQFRVKSAKDFQNVIDNGQKIYSKEYIIYYLNTNTGFNRVGVSVGKKMLKNAVDRNYEKRVLREIISSIYSNIKVSFDFVVISRKPSLIFSYEQKQKIIIQLLSQKKLLMEESYESNIK